MASFNVANVSKNNSAAEYEGSTMSRQSCLLHKPFSSYTQKFALIMRKDFPLPAAQQLKVYCSQTKLHPALSFDSQSNH